MQAESFDSNLAADSETAVGQQILEHLLDDYEGPVAIRLWDGDKVAQVSQRRDVSCDYIDCYCIYCRGPCCAQN